MRHVHVSIRVSADEPLGRRGEPVVVGVSFPRELVRASDSWALFDERQQPRAVQTTMLDCWGDGSIRWLLVEFQADVLGASPSIYSLVSGPPVRIDDPIEVVKSDAGFTIKTKLATFEVPSGGDTALSEARVAQQPVLADLTICGEDAAGRHFRFAVRRTSLGRTGALTAIVHHEGALVGADGATWLDAVVRLQFYAHLGAVRVAVSCANTRAAHHPGGIWDLGDPGSVLIRDLSVTMRPVRHDARSISVSLDREQPMTAAADRLVVYQDSSGGEHWQSINHVSRRGEVPLTFRGFRATAGGRDINGLRAVPVASLGSGEARISIATPHFWQAFPKALSLDESECVVGILPRQFADSHELQGGERTTFSFVVGVGDDPVTTEPLAWARSPLHVSVDPEVYRRAGLWAPLGAGTPGGHQQYDDLVQTVVAGQSSFRDRREAIDEYGWRNFGEIYADHEAVDRPGRISHYNNQYDAIAGMATRFMQTGDERWRSAMDELAAHVTDIDLYQTAGDRAAYNGGYFWHTQHYTDAGTATHRAYSRLSVSSGGGPSNEHNYTTGLLFHYFLTGCERSRAAVIQLANWVIDMDDGRKSRFWWIDRGQTGLASSTRSTDFHGPGRGAGNSINALLDAHRLTGEARYLEKADRLVARCVHPDDDQDAMRLRDAENRWSYTVFLQALGKYLDHRANIGLIDQEYSYAREVLLRYAQWMLKHERFYLERPDELEYPTETWAAQDIRKAAVFEFAARHTVDEVDCANFQRRATEFFDYSVKTLAAAPTGRLVRPLVLLLAYGFQRPLAPAQIEPAALPPLESSRHISFRPQRPRVVRRLLLLGAASGILALATAAWLIL